MNIQNKFVTIPIGDQTYVNVVHLNDVYKTIPGKSGSTQKKIVSELQLGEYASVWRRNKDKSKVGTIASRILDQFKPQMQDLYVDVREVMTPKEGPHKANHIKLLKKIEALPNLADRKKYDSDDDSDDDNSDSKPAPGEPTDPPVKPSAAPAKPSAAPVKSSAKKQLLLPIIELQEHEMFRDADDQVFDIEVRGERSKDKILFSAKDVAAFAENDRLIRTLLDDRKAYQNGIDYQILHEGSMVLVPTKSSANGRGIDHDLVYLTTTGLIRVAAVSRNANANLIKLFDWLQNLFYVHQFGSYEERNELSRSLFKQVLNDQLAGLYCVDLGTFNELYDSMSISRKTYPPEQYGKYRLCKFGLSEQVSTRLAQHKNKKSGYGQWSDAIVLKWLILLPPSQLSKAEQILSNLLKANGFTFDHVDEESKIHKELIMFSPAKEYRVKQLYRQVLALYPSKENDLSKALEDAQSNFETKANLIQSTADNAIMKAQHETRLIKVETQLEVQLLRHQNEVLEMQLKLAKVNLA